MFQTPWYVLATGPLTTQSFSHLEAATQAAQHGEISAPILDLSLLDRIDPDAADQLVGMVERCEVSLLAPDLDAIGAMPARLTTILRESHLEAVEALLTLVRRRRFEGLSDGPVLAELTNEADPFREPALIGRNFFPSPGVQASER